MMLSKSKDDVMSYLVLIGIVLGGWVLNFVVAVWFKAITIGIVEEYEDKMVDNGNNIFAFGLGGVLGIFIGLMFKGLISYIIFGVFAIMVLIGLLRLLFMFAATLILTFNKDHKGIGDRGKLTDWVFMLSSIVENATLIFILFKMYQEFFVA